MGRSLWCLSGARYTFDGQYDKALQYLLQLRRSNVFELIRKVGPQMSRVGVVRVDGWVERDVGLELEISRVGVARVDGWVGWLGWTGGLQEREVGPYGPFVRALTPWRRRPVCAHRHDSTTSLMRSATRSCC